MPFFNKSQLRGTVRRVRTRTASVLLESESNQDVLRRLFVEASASDETFDIFLSHRAVDDVDILGMYLELSRLGYRVFIDWIEEPEFDRSDVTPETADMIRESIERCHCLFYAITRNAPASKWMPWELGYCDGSKGGLAAIVPVINRPSSSELFRGQEYLGLYPYVTQNSDGLWIHTSEHSWVDFDSWLGGEEPQLQV